MSHVALMGSSRVHPLYTGGASKPPQLRPHSGGEKKRGDVAAADSGGSSRLARLLRLCCVAATRRSSRAGEHHAGGKDAIPLRTARTRLQEIELFAARILQVFVVIFPRCPQRERVVFSSARAPLFFSRPDMHF